MSDQVVEHKAELTSNQMSLWLGQQMHPQAPLYNTAAIYEIRGTVDPVIFQEAFQFLVNHTDALRFQFSEERGMPYQMVNPHLNYNIPILDGQRDIHEDVRTYLSKRAQKPLDLSSQVFDACLIVMDPDRSVFFLNLHHLVTDGMSRKILFERLSAYYGQLSEGKKIEVSERASYWEHIVNQRTTPYAGKPQSKDLRAKTAGALPSLSLYGRRAEPGSSSFTRIPLSLGPARNNALKALSQRDEFRGWTEDSSLLNVLSALLISYIYRISGQEKIAIGIPVHNRFEKKFRATVGYFVDLFPMIVDLEDNLPFSELIQAVRTASNSLLKQAADHEAPRESSSPNQVIMNYIPTHYSDFAGMEVKTEWIPSGHMESNHLIRCHASDYDGSGELEVYLDINDSVLDDSLKERIPRHFLALTDALISDPESAIGLPKLSLREEIAEITETEDWRPIKQMIPKCLQQSFEQHGDRTAIRLGDRKWNFKELDAQVRHLVQSLDKFGIRPGDRIAIHQYRSPEYVVSVLACIRIGATFVPIASDQAIGRIGFMLDDSDCKMVLTQAGLEGNIETGTPVLTVDLPDAADLTGEGNFIDHTDSITADSIAYILYTSGSTGNPKGVLIPFRALSNYLHWAIDYYSMEGEDFIFPLFTNIGFDLTITSIFLPLLTGGELIPYKEKITSGADFSILDVIRDNRVNCIKLTPSHIRLILTESLEQSSLKTVIVGGEDFRSVTAKALSEAVPGDLRIYNEYGPTEATIGCIVSRYEPSEHSGSSVPIGLPIRNTRVLVLDRFGNMVPQGVPGELYIGGKGLAKGYLNLPELTHEKFVSLAGDGHSPMYKTGDMVRVSSDGVFEFIGRLDEQVKHNGIRIELADIETHLESHPGIENSSVVLLDRAEKKAGTEVKHCAECGLPSNFPNADFDAHSVCHLCNAFKDYSDRVQPYFKSEEELKTLLLSGTSRSGKYDCLSLLSGGKDSTYVLARLVDMGLNVLAFTLDNGYISDQAKANIDRIVKTLGVDHVYGSTSHMNAIFVDSLQRHANVCNGCFKTIYTLSTQIALEQEIPFIVTGLSRGQFFETRLTEELFWETDTDTGSIDATILEARKIYHKEDDAVKKLLDVSIFQDDKTFDKVQFVDFYRYCDVRLGDMLRFLKEKTGWKRPTDTGRSTNCLINQVGIYVHKNRKGYSNYAFPYSWDVRLGHKDREESLEEINEEIHVAEVKRIMEEIGYDETESSAAGNILVGYYSGAAPIPEDEIRQHLASRLPKYMIPDTFCYVESFPLNQNGKIDKKALQEVDVQKELLTVPYVAPRNEIEELIGGIWQEVLQRDKIGIHENFIGLGGHSLAAIRVTARINRELELDIKLSKIFEHPTIETYAKHIEQTILTLLNS